MNTQKTPGSPKEERRLAAAAGLLQLVQGKLGSLIQSSEISLGDVVLRVDCQSIGEFFRLLKLDTELSFNYFASVTAVDWMDLAENRFEVVYHLMNVEKRYRLRIKVWLPEGQPEIESAAPLWSGANFMEREVWDLMGIRFKGHPDLRRILTYDEFVGHPLRKDYPVQGKQPRVPLRHPEVRNTAVDMKRSALIQINRRSVGGQTASEQPQGAK